MKPHEETWRVRNSTGCSDDIWCEDIRDYAFRTDDPAGAPGYAESAARAKLAAQAPAMARVLLAVLEDWDVGEGLLSRTTVADARAALVAAGVIQAASSGSSDPR